MDDDVVDDPRNRPGRIETNGTNYITG